MKRAISDLREVIQKLVPMLAGKGLQVTQRGTDAYVSVNARTKKPERVNIPNIPDDAPDDFVRAIQGFIDHEVAHVLITDWDVYGGDPAPTESELRDPVVRRRMHMHNITEDTMIEREIVRIFPGARRNIADLRKHFIENVTKKALASAKDDRERFNYLLVPAVRALAGHTEFEDFMDSEGLWSEPMVDHLVQSLKPETIDLLKKCTTTRETLTVADELIDILHKKVQPPEQNQPQQSGGQSQDKPDQEAGEGDGDGERDHQDQPDDDGDQDQDQSGEADGDQDQDQSDEKEDDGDGENSDGSDDGDSEESDDDGDGNGSGDADASEDGDEQADGDAADDGSDGDEGADEQGDGDQSEGGGGDAGEPEDDGDDAGGSGDGDGSDGGDTGSSDGSEQTDEAGSSVGQAGGDVDGDGDSAEATSDASESEGGGYGDGVGKSMFDYDDDAFENAALGEAMAAEISRKSAEVMNVSDWTAYTRDWDVIDYLEPPEKMNKSWVPKLEEDVRSMVGVMQKDVERMMASQSHVVNIPGQRSGRLHSPSLYRVGQGDPRVFTQRQEHHSKATAVSLVIDNSGSMHGSKMDLAMVSGYALSATLERVGIAHEVLGFTTGNYGNLPQSIIDSINKEVVDNAGLYDRLTPIVMPIYKAFNDRLDATVKKRMAYARNAQKGLATNIDGESLLIAAERMRTRTEKRKVMIVLSDGRPVGGPRSGTHLRSTVKLLNESGIETVGVGIMDRNVMSYYDNHTVIDSIDELPGRVMGEIKRILA
jgi:hypothetical protein